MLRTTWVAIVMGFWSSLYLIDAFLKSSRSIGQRYAEFQVQHGIQVSMAQLRWYTTCLNRLFVRIGQCKPSVLHAWFTLGSWFGVLLMFVGAGLLTMTLFNSMSETGGEQVLTPVMPGVNLPVSELGYFFPVLIVSGIWHELGHAIAAVREQVRVNGFGIFFMLVYPGAYVDLHTDHLHAISAARQLRIYCAGIWHNFVLVIFAITVLLTLPYLLSPIYATGTGVVITNVVKNSPVTGKRGLAVGYHVTSINGCPVTMPQDWGKCLSAIVFYPPYGHCLAVGKVQQLGQTVQLYKGVGGQVECCRNDSVSHLCFRYIMGTEMDQPIKNYACLEARPITELARCHKASDCHQARKTACLHPSLDNSSRLIRVLHNTGPPMLYVGDPYLFGYSVSISGYVPKYANLPLWLPDVITTFCKYLISLSGALAILNAVPCYALDGQWVFMAFMEHYVAKIITNPAERKLIYDLTLLFGTLLLGANMIVAMYALIFR